MADGSYRPVGRTDDQVWEQVREDYLSGIPASQVCRTYGLGRSTFWSRASTEGWRRADQRPIEELSTSCDALDDASANDLAGLARTRLGQALAAGRVQESDSWLRIYRTLRQEANKDDLF